MEVKGIAWLGIRTDHYGEMLRLFRDVMGLRVHFQQPDFVDLELPNGDTVELFGPGDKGNEHFTTGPVAGFFVDDIAAAREELEASGQVQFFGPTQQADDGWSWVHFVGPDGNIYELTSGPHTTLR